MLRFNAQTRAQTGQLDLGPNAGAMALSGDGQRLFVARFISAEHHGEIWEVDADTMSLADTIRLRRDRGRSGLDGGGSQGPGVPNYLSSLVIDPHQDWLWYTAIKADTNRGLYFDQGTGLNLPLAHDSTVRPMLGRVDLNANPPIEPGVDSTSNARIDGDNADSPSALAFSPRGDYVFAAFQGNNLVAVFDDLAIQAGGGQTSLARQEVGAAPRGLAWDGETSSLWVENFMSRNVSRIQVGSFLASGDREFTTSHHLSSSTETLSPEVLAGKQIFYFAGNHPEGANQMSFEAYISCASCHIDGRHDGRTWDFTQRGEGFRNTQDLRGRGGMGHGNLHWTANFDEPQDFVLDIVEEFGGLGFLPEGESPNPPLGAPNAGRSAQLDQLAAYLSSLTTAKLPKSPWREFDGSMSVDALSGADVFENLDCSSCHDPLTDYTDSTVGEATLHNVGTIRTSSGFRLGQPLTGMSTQTLLGVWDSAPYFHDGSAEVLEQVFRVAGGEILQAENASLAGGASVPDFIEINWDSTAHGALVTFGDDNASATFTNVDGGSGGPGAIELRINPNTGGVFSITVNGSHYQELSFSQQQVAFQWRRLRFDDVPLNAGNGNTVVVTRESTTSWQSPALDHITVSTADDLAGPRPPRGGPLGGLRAGGGAAVLLAWPCRVATCLTRGLLFCSLFLLDRFRYLHPLSGDPPPMTPSPFPHPSFAPPIGDSSGVPDRGFRRPDGSPGLPGAPPSRDFRAPLLSASGGWPPGRLALGPPLRFLVWWALGSEVAQVGAMEGGDLGGTTGRGGAHIKRGSGRHRFFQPQQGVGLRHSSDGRRPAPGAGNLPGWPDHGSARNRI